MKATLHTDGGARGNPGPAGIGFVLAIENREPVEYGEYIGETTNNQAEYKALLAGLRRALDEAVTDLACYLDSELVVKQVNGEYRIKNEELKPLAREVQDMAKQFPKITFQHVRREKNSGADKLVNKAIDATKKSA